MIINLMENVPHWLFVTMIANEKKLVARHGGNSFNPEHARQQKQSSVRISEQHESIRHQIFD